MTIKSKGKGKAKAKDVAGKSPAGKRKCGFDDDKTGGGRKRNNRGVLQFFEDTADVEESEDSDDSDFSDEFFDEDFDALPRMMNESAKGQSSLPFVPKEELVDEEEFDRMMEERYGDPSRFVSFAEDEFDDKTIDPSFLHTGDKDLVPTIWKVKCTVGRERLSACCLMQKFADLNSLGTKLQIISAFAVDHMKGFVYIEAEKQYDINEACKGIPGIYVTRVQPVPRGEVPHLFYVRSRSPEISEGMWARIKSGNYKGDLAQVVAVNNTRKKVTVKLIPRIDLQALAAKFGGGYSRQKAAVPAPRLISSSELEEFRPLIQFRRDRDTGKVFEVLDGLMLKDGYVYKKVSPDSLSLWGVVPTEEELLKFGSSENNESNDLEWLSQLYGDSKKKRVIRADKGGGKGESSSGSGVVNGFELYDLVCFGKKDFGVIVGMDKDDTYKIIKESSDGPVAVTIERHDIKSGLCDLKLSAQDQHSKTIMVNDSVKVLEGPSKDKQGIVKQIYRGIVFLYDGNQEENGGYFTCKSNMCEKVKLAVGDCSGKDSNPGPLVFEDEPSSPRSPLSPKKPWQTRENNREFNRRDNNSLFTIGQTLRIRIGPLKGYLCRVIALRRSDVTVKLDSQQKVLTVKCEHLSEVQGKSTAMSTSGDPDSSSLKPFDLLGTGGSSGGWMDGVGTSTGGAGWNTGGTSAERSAWSNHSGPSFSKPESASNPFSSEGVENTAWETKNTSNQNSAWGAAVEKSGTASDPDQPSGWGKGGGSWGQAEHKIGNTGDENFGENQPSGWDSKSSWNTNKASEGGSSGWNSVKRTNETSTGWAEGSGFKSGSDDGGNLKSSWSGWNSGTSGVTEAGNSASASDIDDNKGAGWKNKSSKAGSDSSGWAAGFGQTSNWERGLGEGAREVSNWGSMKSGSSAVAESQDSDWGKANNWNSVSGDAGRPKQVSNWGTCKSSSGNENQNSDWRSGHTDPGNQDSSWGKKNNWNTGNSGNLASDPNNSNWNSGSGDSNKNSDWGNNGNQNTNKSSWGTGNENKHSNWSSVNTDPGNQDSSWGKKSNWNSGNSGNLASDPNSSNWNSGSGDSNKSSNLGNNGNQNTNKSSFGTGNENKYSNWSSVQTDSGNQDSSWGKKSNWNSGNSGNLASDPNSSNWNSGSGDSNKNSNWGNNGNQNTNKSSWGTGNENKHSNWSSVQTDSGNQDSSWGKKSNWNSGNSGHQALDPNSSNWNSGSGDSNQTSNWGRNANQNFNKSSWGAGNENRNSHWSSGHTDPGNECPNENSDDRGGSGNWRGGYRGRGGFRGRGFRGRGERGGFGSRGERGGFSGRGERGGFGGGGRSDREGFGGRWGSSRGFGGRGRGGQSGGGNNRRDSGEDGSADWKKGSDNVEGWKSDNGSRAWNQDSSDKGGQSWSQGNADKKCPSWNQGGGSNKQWQSWSSASGSWKNGGSGQLTEAKNGAGWSKEGDFAQENASVTGDNGASQGAWNCETGDKKDGQSWSQRNADKESLSWNQGGGSNKQWQSGTSVSGGASDNWNNNESKQTTEAKDGTGWTSHGDHGSSWKKSTTIEETNIQEGGWNKGSNSNTTSGGRDNQEMGWNRSAVSGDGSESGDGVLSWGQSSAADKGQSSSWKGSADDGAAGSWGKRSDGSDKGGW
ncbi:protein RNA-directed DNA methylation 3 [Abrus precatorius]|uniref:Protein RNA-directed DNA methylation 3 n=1 Tax=Abrus precatorius TaxID=3816 RepID=A0A8B8MD32_ABRPR|nr:protein RNA-directed DNA methylation 3 [Abrus precatorius]